MVKKIGISFFLIIIIISQVPSSQVLEEILAKYYRSLGGLDKLASLKSIKTVGKYIPAAEESAEMPIAMWFKFPDKVKIESQYQGQTLVQAFDGETAWFIMPHYGIKDAEPMPESQAQDFISNADYFPLVDYKKKGYRIEYLGTEEYEGRQVHKVKLSTHTGGEIIFFLEKNYGMNIKTQRTAANGARVESVKSDFRKVGWLLIPFSTEMRLEGNTISKIVLEAVEINPELDDSFFTIPQTKN